MAADPWAEFESVSPASAAANDAWAGFEEVEPAAPSAPVAPQQPTGDLVDAANETALTMGSAALAAPIAGLAGLGSIATNAAGWSNVLPEEIVRKVQEALTYRPRTRAGEVGVGVVSYPFEKLAQGADWLGNKVNNATGSPAAATAVNVGIQSLPAALVPALRRGGAEPVAPLELAPEPPPAAASASILPEPIAPSTQPQTVPRGSILPTAEPAPVAPDLVLQTTTRPTARPSTSPPNPEAQARDYVRSNGLDWAALPGETKATLTEIAKSASGFDGLDTAALNRQLQLQSLPKPVPATRGVITRDPVQLRNEGNVAATRAGAPIREVHLDANQALLDNLDILKGRVANKTRPAETPEQVGLSVQDQALRAKLELKRQEVRDRYKAAEDAGELQAPVSPARLIQTIRNAPDKTHMKWVESWLKDMEVVKQTDSGTVTSKLTLKQFEDLRQAAVARAMDGGTEGYYAGKVIDAIDRTTESAGGKLYAEARKARREQALEFEETGAIARLVENKSRTDRATALEDTWRKTVKGGSVQDLRNVKRSLLTGGDRQTRAAGKRAWRDVKAQTIQYIKDEATKSVATNERGQANVTPASMKRAIDSIGQEKLDEIFGAGTARRLNNILEATRTVKTEPPPIHKGSSTMGNVLAFLERGLDSIPGGGVVTGTARAVSQVKQMGDAGRVVRQSQRTPLQDAAEEAKKRNKLADF
jgi:hypothetical protein